MATYTADSPEAIIEHFERLARNAEISRVGALTHREGHILLAEARTWRNAADMLRNTEFIGWPFSGKAAS